MGGSLSTRELCERFSQLYPGAVTDVLDEMSLEDQTLDRRIDPLTNEMTVAGIAYPILGRPNRSVDDERNIRRILQMLSDAPRDAVLMYDTNDTQFSHIGELSVAVLQEQGCRGAVVDGGVRDVSYILEYDFPVFSRHKTPADAVPRWEILDWGVRAVVGGVEVRPGDVVIGDVDGVVVVPQDIAEEVLHEAEAVANTENELRETIRNGADPLDAYDEYGRF